MRPIGKFAAIARGLVANELVTPDITVRHRQLIRLIWTRNGMGERYYSALGPPVSYSKFEARVTALLDLELGSVTLFIDEIAGPMEVGTAQEG